MGNIWVKASDIKASTGYEDFICKASDISKMCRPTYLEECHLENLRKEYNDQSVCASAGDTCRCSDPDCKDDPTFIDEKGYYCDSWVGDSCEVDKIKKFDYSDQAAKKIQEKCKRSCGMCPWAACSGKLPACPEPVVQECRACKTEKVSGTDLAGRHPCCTAKGEVCKKK